MNMRKLRGGFLAVSLSFIAMGALAQGQFGPEGGPYQPDSVSARIDHVHTDLNHGYSVWHLSRRDRDRLNHAESQLRNFSGEWRKGKFDKGNLGDAINDTQHILDRNHLAGAERDALWSDVEQLRRMREAYDRHEIGRW
jgi:hypothetical protein